MKTVEPQAVKMGQRLKDCAETLSKIPDATLAPSTVLEVFCTPQPPSKEECRETT